MKVNNIIGLIVPRFLIVQIHIYYVKFGEFQNPDVSWDLNGI